MSLKKNIFASYVAQIYVTLIGILILPMYLKYMGSEAYGLVGFFTMLQAWFNLIDLGLTPTVARETARFQAGGLDALTYRRLLRTLQIFFYSIAFLGGGILFTFSSLIAENWLNVKDLPISQVELSLKMMAISIAFRWVSGFYRSCITGAEQLVWLSKFNCIVATFRFGGAIPLVMFYRNPLLVFFLYQMLVAIFEMILLAVKAYRYFPAVKSSEIGWSFLVLVQSIHPILKFSLAISFSSLVWVMVTQSDKLVLSKILPLDQYGYFTLAVLAASGITMIGGPISNSLMPRMTSLQVKGQESELLLLYRNATQIVSIAAIPACLVLSFFAEEMLWVWTGDLDAAKNAKPILQLYALGNGFLAVSAFPYYLQYAKGDLKLHLIGNLIFMMLLVPLIILSSWKYGAIGAGYAWMGINAAYFFVWVPIVHGKFSKGLHKDWIFKDVGPILIVGLISLIALNEFVVWPRDRFGAFCTLAACSTFALIICATASRKFGNKAFVKIKAAIKYT